MSAAVIESPARNTIAVASGKGGVGNSTVTLNLARSSAFLLGEELAETLARRLAD